MRRRSQRQMGLLGAVSGLALMLVGCQSTSEGDSIHAFVEVSTTVVDAEALTIEGGFGVAINGKSFQSDMIASFAGHQYVAYYDAARHVCLARRELPSGEWETLRFLDYDFKSNDAHNTISLGICASDGTLHLAFDHHGDPLHYRRSVAGLARGEAPWAASSFGPVTSSLEKDRPIRITYPRFLATPDGELQFFYRRGGSGRGDRMLVDYDGTSGAWSGTRQIDSGVGEYNEDDALSDSRCSYPNGYDYDEGGTLHATWVWRESSQGANHDLVHVQSSDGGRTWRSSAGAAYAEAPSVKSSGAVVARIPSTWGLMNTHGQAVDPQGRLHVVMWHCTPATLEASGSRPGEMRWGPPDARRYHHYWRDLDGTWQHFMLPWTSGGRPKVLMDADSNALLIYRGTRQFQPDGPLKIAAASARSNWTDWRVIHTEPGSFINEMLPDKQRWKAEGVLSVPLQKAPDEPHQATPLRVLDLRWSNP